MHEPYETYHFGNDNEITLDIIHDDSSYTPLEMRESLGVITFHRSVEYDIGHGTYGGRDYTATEADIREYVLDGEDVRVLIPLRFDDYGSSGARLHADAPILGKRACAAYLRNLDDEERPDDNGYAYLLAPKLLEEYGSTDIRACKRAASCMSSEIEELAHYVSGNVWGWSVHVTGMPHLDESVWGFYCEPDGYVVEDGREHVEWVREKLAEELHERAEMAARDIVTVAA